MSSMKYRSIFEVMALSSIIVVVDFVISAIVVVFIPQSLFGMVSNLLLLEFAILLVVGGCMLSRQPMKQKSEDETSSGSRDMYYFGRILLASSIFMLLFSVLFALMA